MSKTWFTSDTHFGHDNIIRYCNRPFTSVEEMDERLIENWNANVRPNDIVYHLGDFAFGKGVDGAYAARIRKRLNGHIHLILGNHEEAAIASVAHGAKWESIHSYFELKKNGAHIVLFHYPLRSWHRGMRGSWHLYGHCHGGVPTFGRSLDIGVDCWDFRPVSFGELEHIMPARPVRSEEKGFVCRTCQQFPCVCA